MFDAKIKLLLFSNCQFMLLSTDIVYIVALALGFLFNPSKFYTYLCTKRGKGA